MKVWRSGDRPVLLRTSVLGIPIRGGITPKDKEASVSASLSLRGFVQNLPSEHTLHISQIGIWLHCQIQ